MELLESLKRLSERVDSVKEAAPTEEATKNALVLPFLNALGYDVFNPREVAPEYTCDFGIKKGEKVDFAICQDGAPLLLVECKHWGQNLDKHNGQLFRYFAVSKAQFGCLTNGVEYRFYGDLDNPNILDSSPFFTYRIDAPERGIEAISRFAKGALNAPEVVKWARAQKDSARVKSALTREFADPSADFVRVVLSALEINATPKTIEQFAPIVKNAVSQIVNDRIASAFTRALNADESNDDAQTPEAASEENSTPEQEKLAVKDRIVTTVEELEAFFLVRSLLRNVVAPTRVKHRDSISYFAILFDNNNRKPICRLYLESGGEERKKKFIGLFDKDKNETRFPIKSIDDIYRFEKELTATVQLYL